MPWILDWMLRFGPTNPICVRLAETGSRRKQHLTIRSAFLGILMVVLLFGLLGETGTLREMAQRGAAAFTIISFGQVFLICLLTPVFMAGAITQEANEQTWDILLTTPLNAMQIVLGNLFGRLFFIFALLISMLPVFAVTQFFGGVPGSAIFASMAIAAASAFAVGAIAITLSVTRTAGRRAVFIFYVCVALYLFVTWAIDSQLRMAVAPGSQALTLTVMTPLNPFLALESLLLSNSYKPPDLSDMGFFGRLWFGHAVWMFDSLCVLLGLFLVVFSTARLRVIGARQGQRSKFALWLMPTRAEGARGPRKVSQNPIAWWERQGRGRTLGAVIGRWSFVVIGIGAMILVLALYVNGTMSVQNLRASLLTLLSAEVVIITLTALNLSASAVSREREDGTLDLILTTPIQPGPYLRGKLSGIIQNLLPMLLVPIVSLGLVAIFVLAAPFGAVTTQIQTIGTDTVELPIVLPEAALALPFLLIGFTAFCVMVGLHWSVKCRGTMQSISASVAVVVLVAGVFGLCGISAGASIEVLGGFLAALSPVNLVLAAVDPAEYLSASVSARGSSAGRTALFIGAFVAASGYIGVVFGMHASLKRGFMMTVRRLAGT